MKCIYIGCKCQSVIKVKQSRPNVEPIGFCSAHLPKWIVGGKSLSPYYIIIHD